jgi:hypothetical protein
MVAALRKAVHSGVHNLMLFWQAFLHARTKPDTPEDEHRVGDYRANYRLPTPEELHAPDPELDELFKNSTPIRR